MSMSYDDFNGRLFEAADEACRWLEGFRFNHNGLACEDDYPNHEEMAKRLRHAIKEMRLDKPKDAT